MPWETQTSAVARATEKSRKPLGTAMSKAQNSSFGEYLRQDCSCLDQIQPVLRSGLGFHQAMHHFIYERDIRHKHEQLNFESSTELKPLQIEQPSGGTIFQFAPA